jgi:hypothetical protein
VACAVLFGLSAGAVDAALNAYAARHFGVRQVNLMHAAYGIGAATSPLIVTAVIGMGKELALGLHHRHGHPGAVGRSIRRHVAAMEGRVSRACRCGRSIDRGPILGTATLVEANSGGRRPVGRRRTDRP